MGSHPQFDRTLGLLLLVSAGLFLLAVMAMTVRGAPEPAAPTHEVSERVR
jgi:hypothetical protein